MVKVKHGIKLKVEEINEKMLPPKTEKEILKEIRNEQQKIKPRKTLIDSVKVKLETQMFNIKLNKGKNIHKYI